MNYPRLNSFSSRPYHPPIRRGLRMGLLLVLSALISTAARAGDWPTYRHDISRSGITSNSLELPLVESWKYQPRHKPTTAWDEPNPRPVGGWYGLNEGRRVHFDDALHVVVSNGAVYFGSSADGRVVSLDVNTGQQRWRANTNGPVRLAPTIWQDKVYVGSDDGFVYCLRGDNGAEHWKYQAAPAHDKLLGSGKMVSLWPIRTGVLVDDSTAYFGAGIFPAHGVYIHAVNADTGELVWCNDGGGAAPQSRISPQGYLLASPERLFVPLGRVSPAAFDRRDGKLLYETYIEHIIGGSNATLAGNKLYTGTEEMIGFDESSSRDRSSWFWSHQLVVAPKVFYVSTGKELFAVNRDTYGAASLKRKTLLDQKRSATTALTAAKRGPKDKLQKAQDQLDAINAKLKGVEAEMAEGQLWRVRCNADESLILAGKILLAGSQKSVQAFDAETGKSLWKTELDGKARGLAVAENRLFVSCDSGSIYCFGPKGSPTPGSIAQEVNASPFPNDQLTPVFERAAEHIVTTTGVDRGYCLVLGCGTGRLAYELAKRTDLHICGIEPDAQKANAAREALDDAGLYGARITIECGDLSDVPYSDYFANLIVSESTITSGKMPGGAEEAIRMLKPLGGRICIGQPAAIGNADQSLTVKDAQRWLAETKLAADANVSSENGIWIDYERGSLPGAGSWTHQYAEPGNSTCGDDQLVRCPLELLWFGGPGPRQMADRHLRAAAPLAVNGRLFVLGEGTANRTGVGANSVRAYDAYNGVKLWERQLKGALRVTVTHDSGNWAATDDSLLVSVGDTCLQLDAATGKTQHTHLLPKASDAGPYKWGYVAVADNVLYGSRTLKGRIADCVFAIDLSTKKLLWKHEIDGIAQGSIAVSNGRLHFAASKVTKQQREQALSPQIKEVHRLSETARAAVLKKIKEATVYNVIAVDARSGKELWSSPIEITGAVGGAYWCSLGAICKDDVLVLFGVFLDGHYWTQFMAGQFESRQVVALSAKDGQTIWRKPIGYRVRPIVVGDTLHAEPWAYDLKTGVQRTRIHPVTGKEEVWQFARPGHHCGAPAAAPHMLLFRSLNLAWYDLDEDFGTQHFGGQRPGCWINFIPANGLLLVPEASSGCMCAFPTTCTVVFKNGSQNRQWAYFSQPGSMTPVKRLGLNLGAPGDRKDTNHRLWLGYPRPGGSLVLQFPISLSYFPGYKNFKHDPAKLDIANTTTPWVYRSGISGLREARIPVTTPADGPARYTVRLGFADLENNSVGKRVFDIKIQGKVVAKNFDICQQAGGKNRAVTKEFSGIDADKEIKLELVPKNKKPARDELPLLQAIEIEREKVLALGVAVPDFLLSDADPAKSGNVEIVNHGSTDFVGKLRLNGPEGFSITPKEQSITIPSGQRQTIPMNITTTDSATRGRHTLEIHLLRSDGTTDSKQERTIEHLGNQQRIVFQATEDAHVIRRVPTTNSGKSSSLNVDGGDRKMADQHHGISYMKFKLSVPGKPVSATLRIHNGNNPSVDSGRIALVTDPWKENTVTYENRPKPGKTVATIGRVIEYQVVELPLSVPLDGIDELSLAIDPTTTDGLNYVSREGGKPPELIIEYLPDETPKE